MIKTRKDRCQDTYRRSGWGPGGWFPSLGAGDARRKRDAAGGGGAVGGFQGGGVMVCRGWLGGGDPAAICGGNSAVFNQLLTIFLAVAMVWRLPVFFLCSYCLFWRLLGRFRLPGAWVEVGGWSGRSTGGRYGAVGCQNRKGEG